MTKENSYSLAKQTKDLLKKHNIHLNKNLGQNYLIDENKKNQIINFANLSKKDIVLEIGSGIGTLTTDLALKSKKVISIEQDNNIFKILEERLFNEDINNVELINEDALNIDFPKFNKIVSNLPYQISSPITFKFLEYDFESAILMYQKEFAHRMNGQVGTKDYSRLSAMLYFKCEIEILTNISAQSFIPKPKIDSSLVKLSPKLPDFESDSLNQACKEINKKDYEIYSIFTKTLFQHRNKKVRNALIDSRHEINNLDKKEFREKLSKINSSKINELLTKRVITISPEEILYLSKYLNNIFK